MTKEVRYDLYCKYCEFMTKSASDDPCNECLGTPSNGDSHVPVNFKKGKPLINYLLPDVNLPNGMKGYTRDWAVSMNWCIAGIPTDTELKEYFELREDGDYWEKEIAQ